jgi:hypothetical protein
MNFFNKKTREDNFSDIEIRALDSLHQQAQMGTLHHRIEGMAKYCKAYERFLEEGRRPPKDGPPYAEIYQQHKSQLERNLGSRQNARAGT